jgi:hypothetical protein
MASTNLQKAQPGSQQHTKELTMTNVNQSIAFPSTPFIQPLAGPNGHPVGYDVEGNFVEWLPDQEDETGTAPPYPMILRRSDASIIAIHKECWDRVWYVRHKVSMQEVAEGKKTLDPEILKRALKGAHRIEQTYGVDTLYLDDWEYGCVSGKLSALTWVLGTDWEDTLST